MRPGTSVASSIDMDWTALDFLARPWFVIPWYAVGIVGAVFVGVDLATKNTPLKSAMKWAWPIVVVFFSVIGLALYFLTARPPGIGAIHDPEQKQQALDRYEQSMVRRVNGAVIHCIAGDGLGIMTGMVIARAIRFSFWEEFWFEYAVGFLFGWLIFQLKSMTMMTESKPKALAMAFRAEFFSMLTVMAGMGAVMAYVTPMAVTAQPRPLTYAFWGFGALGLVVGYLFTFPMNWMMIKEGWKHGMGSKEGARPVHARGAKIALASAMVVLGFVALLVPGWLVVARERTRVEAPSTASATQPVAVADGAHETIATAIAALDAGDNQRAVIAVDAAHRLAEVLARSNGQAAVLDAMKHARRALWMGDRREARARLEVASQQLESAHARAAQPESASRYGGATLLDPYGNEIGEVDDVRDGRAVLAIGGVRDFWGFIDVSATRNVEVPAERLVYGPARTLGWTYAVYLGNPGTTASR